MSFNGFHLTGHTSVYHIHKLYLIESMIIPFFYPTDQDFNNNNNNNNLCFSQQLLDALGRGMARFSCIAIVCTCSSLTTFSETWPCANQECVFILTTESTGLGLKKRLRYSKIDIFVALF